MLTSLLIKDFALIGNLDIQFHSGLTILTGETGAGKSILIDALGLVLGDRSDTTMIRQGTAKSIVEATFDVKAAPKIMTILSSMNVDIEQQVIVRREISSKGQSRCFVNDSPVSVSSLKALGDALVDVHGQHEHQSLLNAKTHIEILDAYGELESLRESYAASFTQFKHLVADLRALYERRHSAGERKAVLEYQLREINKVNPRDGEDEVIERELQVAEHSERLAFLSNEALNLLYDGEGSIIEKLGRSGKNLEALGRIDASMQSLIQENSSASVIIEELVRTIRSYVEKIEFDPAHIESARARLGELILLKRKYAGTLRDVIAKRDELQTEYDSMDSLDGKITSLETEIETVRSECSSKAALLTEKRKSAATKLGRQIEAALKELGIAHPTFTTQIMQREHHSSSNDLMYLARDKSKLVAQESGWDVVEFYLSTNVGEEVKPLARVVSGGEVSRIMLSIKSILAQHDAIPMLVFDEIDVGVSGKIAQKVGTALKKLSQYHQIISITHLPQIAALGDHHYVVEKVVTGKRSLTTVRKLDEQEREMEVARLLSGHEVTNSSLQSAKELMNAV